MASAQKLEDLQLELEMLQAKAAQGERKLMDVVRRMEEVQRQIQMLERRKLEVMRELAERSELIEYQKAKNDLDTRHVEDLAASEKQLAEMSMKLEGLKAMSEKLEQVTKEMQLEVMAVRERVLTTKREYEVVREEAAAASDKEPKATGEGPEEEDNENGRDEPPAPVVPPPAVPPPAVPAVAAPAPVDSGAAESDMVAALREELEKMKELVMVGEQRSAALEAELESMHQRLAETMRHREEMQRSEAMLKEKFVRMQALLEQSMNKAREAEDAKEAMTAECASLRLALARSMSEIGNT